MRPTWRRAPTSAATRTSSTARSTGSPARGVSRLHLIFARVFDERGEEWASAVSSPCARNKGLRIGKREPTMGLRGMPEAEIIFEDLEVPASMVVLPPSGFRRGFADLMNAYNSQRVGAGTVALGVAGRRARSRAGMGQDTRAIRPSDRRIPGPAMDACRYADAADRRAADALSGGAFARPRQQRFPDPMLAAQAKIFASETAIKIVNDALQIFGARGYSREFPLERMARDVRMFTIGGGTAQVLRTLVASKMLGWKLPQTRDGYYRSLRCATPRSNHASRFLRPPVKARRSRSGSLIPTTFDTCARSSAAPSRHSSHGRFRAKPGRSLLLPGERRKACRRAVRY